MLEQTKWGEFRLGDLFNIRNTPSFNTDKLTKGNEYDYITRTSFNQWILQSTWFVNKENINEAWVWSLWLLQMDFFYRKKPWYAGQFVRKIVPKFKLSQGSILFFSAILNCQKKVLLSVLVRHVDETFKNIKIQLPVKNWKPDFDFMNKFIAELEATHQAELEAYLRTTWLKNCELTSSELELLKDFEEWKIQWWKFQIWWENGLFNINSSKKKFDANKVNIWEYWYNYVVRTSLNNWIRGLIDEGTNFLNNGNTISFWQDTATMFYQENPYFTWDKIKIVNSKEDSFNKLNAQFFITTMTKVFSSFSWWSSSFNVKIIESQNIIVPIKNWKPDYELMEKFILAIQKLVIKDIVVYNQEKLKASEELLAW